MDELKLNPPKTLKVLAWKFDSNDEDLYPLLREENLSKKSKLVLN